MKGAQLIYDFGGSWAKIKTNKRPTGLNSHLSIGDFTLTSCQKGSYFFISPSQKKMKINDSVGKQHNNPLKQQQPMCCILIEQKIIHIHYNVLHSHAPNIRTKPWGVIKFTIWVVPSWVIITIYILICLIYAWEQRRRFLGHLSHSGDLLLWVGVRRRALSVVRRPLISSSQNLLSQS